METKNKTIAKLERVLIDLASECAEAKEASGRLEERLSSLSRLAKLIKALDSHVDYSKIRIILIAEAAKDSSGQRHHEDTFFTTPTLQGNIVKNIQSAVKDELIEEVGLVLDDYSDMKIGDSDD